MSYRATFLDGPLEGPEHERHFASGGRPPARRLYFARLSEELGGYWAGRWALVGYDPGPGRLIGANSNDEVRYDLASVDTETAEPVAHYRVAPA